MYTFRHNLEDEWDVCFKFIFTGANSKVKQRNTMSAQWPAYNHVPSCKSCYNIVECSHLSDWISLYCTHAHAHTHCTHTHVHTHHTHTPHNYGRHGKEKCSDV